MKVFLSLLVFALSLPDLHRLPVYPDWQLHLFGWVQVPPFEHGGWQIAVRKTKYVLFYLFFFFFFEKTVLIIWDSYTLTQTLACVCSCWQAHSPPPPPHTWTRPCTCARTCPHIHTRTYKAYVDINKDTQREGEILSLREGERERERERILQQREWERGKRKRQKERAMGRKRERERERERERKRERERGPCVFHKALQYICRSLRAPSSTRRFKFSTGSKDADIILHLVLRSSSLFWPCKLVKTPTYLFDNGFHCSLLDTYMCWV